MNENQLRSAMRKLDQINGPTAIPPAVQRRAKQRRLGIVALSGCVATVTIAGLVLGTSIAERYNPGPVSPSTLGSPEPQVDHDGWRVTVSVQPSRIGQLAISVSSVRSMTTSDAHPWVQHDVIFENLGENPIQFEDTRSSAFLPNEDRPILLAADQGCGYGKSSPTSPIEAGLCQDYLDDFTVLPQRSDVRTITLFKEQPGMAEMREGMYVFDKTIQFSVDDGSKWTKELKVIYTIEMFGES